jgi:Leucine-rich repeat (LRR) protein
MVHKCNALMAHSHLSGGNESLSLKSNKSRVTFSDSDAIELDSLEPEIESNNDDNNNEEDGHFCEMDRCVTSGFASPPNGQVYSARDIKMKNLCFQATVETSEPKRMDIGGSGLQTIPEIVLQSTNMVEELLAGQNKLQEGSLRSLADFNNLKVLRLPGNGFKTFPDPIFDIHGLKILDLADNEVSKIPERISQLKK